MGNCTPFGPRRPSLNDYLFSLTPDDDDTNTVFRFKSVIKDTTTISLGTFARIQHVLSGLKIDIDLSDAYRLYAGHIGAWLRGFKDVKVPRIDRRHGVATLAETEATPAGTEAMVETAATTPARSTASVETSRAS